MNKYIKKLNITLFVLNILFFTYYFILMLYNGFAADDYGFLVSVRDSDVFSWVSGVYMNFSGRFVRYFLYYWKYRLFNICPQAPILYPLIAYCVYISSIYFVLSRIKQNSVDNKSLGLFSALFVNIAIAISFERTAFFWLAAIDFYSSAILYPIWLLYFCFICQNKTASYIGLSIISFIIGGSNEAFSPLVMFIIFAYILFDIYKNRRLRPTEGNIRLIVSFFIIAIATIVVFASPGNSNRISLYVEKPSILSMLLISVESTAVFYYLLAFKTPYIILIMLVSACFGMSCHKTFKFNKNLFFYSLACLLFLVWISTFPAAYGMGGFGFQRIYTPTLTWLLAFCCVFSFALGQSIDSSKGMIIFVCTYIAVVMGAVAQIANICIDTNTARNYRNSEIVRNNFILEEKAAGRSDTLFVEPLSSLKSFDCKSLIMGKLMNNNKKPVLYYGNGLWPTFEKGSDDSYTNECLMNYWELSFVICEKKEYCE